MTLKSENQLLKKKITQPKSWFFENFSKIDKASSKNDLKRQRETQLNQYQE